MKTFKIPVPSTGAKSIADALAWLQAITGHYRIRYVLVATYPAIMVQARLEDAVLIRLSVPWG